ncbi:unnamed protein product [Rhizoctonia solani]|uniref:Uncharacterized protein n=1 Tax=Rhizoctonia solani TaxID=456999 RepID=A0A8H3DQ37_9AGAM|nr:unnamed protein product [Rhizoctonia solani]
MSYTTGLLYAKKAIILGGSSGVGRAVAAAALAHGTSVVICSSSQERVNAAVAKLGKGIEGIDGLSIKGRAFDIKNTVALKSLLTEEGPFDHLVITAGDPAAITNFPHQEIDENARNQFESRFWSVVIAAQHIHRNNLIRPGGSITLTTGSAHFRPLPGWGVVNGVVGAVESMTCGLAVDLKPIRVNAIALGLVDTEPYEKTPSEFRKSLFKTHADKVLVNHVGTPEEVAEAYIFAMKASKPCQYLTGQIILVDGGGVLV